VFPAPPKPLHSLRCRLRFAARDSPESNSFHNFNSDQLRLQPLTPDMRQTLVEVPLGLEKTCLPGPPQNVEEDSPDKALLCNRTTSLTAYLFQSRPASFALHHTIEDATPMCMSPSVQQSAFVDLIQNPCRVSWGVSRLSADLFTIRARRLLYSNLATRFRSPSHLAGDLANHKNSLIRLAARGFEVSGTSARLA
jgi:hypothetical protein